MRNQRGETLVETMVSLSMVAIILACVAVIIMFSTRMSQNALSSIQAADDQVAAFQAGVFSDAVNNGTATIELSYEINKSGGGGNVVSRTPYTVGTVIAYKTGNGFIVLGENNDDGDDDD